MCTEPGCSERKMRIYKEPLVITLDCREATMKDRPKRGRVSMGCKGRLCDLTRKFPCIFGLHDANMIIWNPENKRQRIQKIIASLKNSELTDLESAIENLCSINTKAEPDVLPIQVLFVLRDHAEYVLYRHIPRNIL
jgi:hypothetical protein